MPDQISFDLAIGIGAALFSVIGVLIVALSHVYAQLIRKDIKHLSEDVKDVKDETEKLHVRMTGHIEKYHAKEG